MTRTVKRSVLAVLCTAVVGLWVAGPSGQAPGFPSTKNGEWPYYTADVKGSRYSPLDQINATNFNQLEVAWRFKTDNMGTRPEYKLEGTPLMVKGVIYATGGTRRSVVALDAKSGEIIWVHGEKEGARAVNAPRQLSGRGLSYWTDGKGDDRVIYVTPGFRLIALNAKNGVPFPDSEQRRRRHEGRRRGRQGNPDRPGKGEIGLPSTPTVAKDVILVGSSFREGLTVKTHNNTRVLLFARGTRRAANCSGRSTRFLGPANSATAPGKKNRGRLTATPASGHRSPSTKSSASCICRLKIRHRISMAATAPGTTCLATASCASI